MRINQSSVSKMLLFAICMLVLSSTHAQVAVFSFQQGTYSTNESDSEAFVVQVSLEYGVLNRTVELQLLSRSGSAIENLDYIGINQTVVFSPDGPSSVPVSITILPDDLVERDETFSIGLTTSQKDGASGNIVIGRDVAQITIDDLDTAVIEIVGMRDVVREGEGNARFNIRLLSGELGIPVDLVYSTYNINATGGEDYVAVLNEPATLSSLLPSFEGLIVVNDDRVFEGEINERFGVQLSLLSGVPDRVIIETSVLEIQIEDNEPKPVPTCGQLPELVNGALSLSSGVNEGSVAMYTCDTGFNLIGSATRTCTSDEGWTPAVPVCLRIIDCGRLLSPSNGNVATPSGTTVGNVALYSCDNGLLLTGPFVRVCGNNELWTPDAPTCEEALVALPPSLPENFQSVEVGTTSIEFLWTQDEVVTGYILDITYIGPCTLNSQSMFLDGSLRSYTITGLEEGSSYTIELSALNGAGRSEGSQLQILTLGTVPSGPPQSVRPTTIDTNVIALRWDKVNCLERNNLEPLQYFVEYSQSEGATRTIITSGQNVTIRNLEPGTMYIFQVAGENDAGRGPFASLSHSTLSEPTVTTECPTVTECPVIIEYRIASCITTDGVVILPSVVTPINCIEGDLRLVNGENELEGRVEVCFYGIWRTICDDSWDVPDATVVCNQLGHSVEGAEAFGRAMFGEGEGPILLNDVNCTGNEERLENCGSNDYVVHNCTHGEDAGVRCMALRGLVVTQPVRLPLDLRLITENLIAPTDDFEYYCVVNGVNLTAQYENENTILCIVGSGNLTLSAGVGSSLAVVMVVMVILPVNNVNNTLSSTVPLTEVTLYDCRNLASGCLECIAAGIGLQFPCGWCGGSCEVMQECSNSFITEGDNCPAPVINSFTPMSGPVQGGTEITVNGTDLGVTFADIQSSNLTLGGVACSPINTGYKIGCQFVCMTTNLGTEGPKNFSLTIGSREAIVNAGSFTAVYPTVNSVTPTFGPMAGGTIVAVSGTGLDVGNQEDTRVSLNISGSSYVCNVLLLPIQSHEIRCTTTEANFTSNAMVVVSIDAATISNPELVFSYLDNPNVINVFPSNTISSGGIMLTFTGLNFDVVQQPVLEVYQPFEAPLRSNCSLGNGTICSAVNITTITCSTPNVSGISLNYALLFDDVPPTTQACFPISVQSDPSNFRLETSEEVITGTVNFLRIVGDNLDSVETSEIRVTVGGEECVLTPSERRSVIICTAPFKPPGGGNTSIINVTVGSNIAQELHKRLTYKVPVAAVILPVTDRVPLQEIIISLSAIIFLLVVCVLIVFICLYLNYRKKKSVSIKMHQQNMELVAIGRYQEIVDGNTALVKSELNKIAESIPDSFKIPSSTLKLSSNTIGQGEFGIVYKGVLIDWNNVPMQGVAVKTLKGLFSLSDVQSMVCEVNKMQDLHHPHVMSLIGVCLDAGPGIAIVIPYMENGSLFDYLKKERDILELDDDCEIDQILAVRKLLLKMCHQIALGMAYLAEQKFVHRDLAARNCMLDSGGGIRVGDFGLAEDIYASGYFRQNNRANAKVPYKWMALESLNDAIFTEKTDVWSYGVTVWEIFNGGRSPYPAVDPLSLIQLLEEGRRLERSLNAACATEISVVMRKCWKEDPEERPTFSQLSSIVERLLTAIAGYTELGMVLVDTSQEEEQHKYDYVSPPTELPGNLPSPDPLITENSAYGFGDSQEKEELTDPLTTENSAYGLGYSQEKKELNSVPTLTPTGEVPDHYDDLPSVTA